MLMGENRLCFEQIKSLPGMVELSLTTLDTFCAT